MRKSNWPFIQVNDCNEINSLLSFAGMNDPFDLHIITHHYSEAYCGYFRRLVFGNSLTFSHIPPCFHAKLPISHVCVTPVGLVVSLMTMNYRANWYWDTIVYIERQSRRLNIATGNIQILRLVISFPKTHSCWLTCNSH